MQKKRRGGSPPLSLSSSLSLEQALLLSTFCNNSQPATTRFFATDRGLNMGVKRATSLFYSFCSNVAKQVVRFYCPFYHRRYELACETSVHAPGFCKLLARLSSKEMGNVSVYAGNQFPISELFSSPLTPSFMFLANCRSKKCVNHLNSIQNSHFPPSLFVNVRFPLYKAQSTPRLSFDTRSNLGTHVPLPLVIFAFIFRIKIV